MTETTQTHHQNKALIRDKGRKGHLGTSVVCGRVNNG